MLSALFELHCALDPGPRRALGVVKSLACVGLMCLLMGTSVGRTVGFLAEVDPGVAMKGLAVVLFIPLLTGPIEVVFGLSLAELRQPEHREPWHAPVLFLLFVATLFGSMFAAGAILHWARSA